MGSVNIEEGELSQNERFQMTLSKIISKFSNFYIEDTEHNKWANGKEIILELFDKKLKLIDPKTLNDIYSSHLSNICAWCIGNNNEKYFLFYVIFTFFYTFRDFAFIARHADLKHFSCYVFRCEFSAQLISDALQKVCNDMLLNETNLYQKEAKKNFSISQTPSNQHIDKQITSMLFSYLNMFKILINSILLFFFGLFFVFIFSKI